MAHVGNVANKVALWKSISRLHATNVGVIVADDPGEQDEIDGDDDSFFLEVTGN